MTETNVSTTIHNEYVIDVLDIDECINIDTNNCEELFGECKNIDGGFTCQCASGSSGDGVMCSGNFQTKISWFGFLWFLLILEDRKIRPVDFR